MESDTLTGSSTQPDALLLHSEQLFSDDDSMGVTGSSSNAIRNANFLSPKRCEGGEPAQDERVERAVKAAKEKWDREREGLQEYYEWKIQQAGEKHDRERKGKIMIEKSRKKGINKSEKIRGKDRKVTSRNCLQRRRRKFTDF